MTEQEFLRRLPTFRNEEDSRSHARLTKLIEDWDLDGCPEHSDCHKPECLAREIIERQSTWD